MPWVEHKLLSGFSWFKRGETSAEHSEQSDYPSTDHTDENMEKVHKIINEERWNTISETTGRFGLSYRTVQLILKEGLNK